MSQRPRHILTSSDEETEGNPEVVAAETTSQKTPTKTPKKTPTPAPLSVKKKRALEEADTETPRAKKCRISKRNLLLWKHFQTTNDPNVVVCIAKTPRARRPLQLESDTDSDWIIFGEDKSFFLDNLILTYKTSFKKR
jgi:hypothetical protein